MMVSETFPLHLFPLGLTTTEKVRPALSRVLVILRLARRACLSCGSARRAYPHAPARSRGFPPARERCRPPGAARRSRDSYASRKPSLAVTVRNVSRLYPLPVRTILDRCTPQVGVRLALSQLLLFGHNRACRAGL